MALDDQLAALAAGELDDDTARALRARAAADPALARRLARHEQLQQLLADWEAPTMSEDAAQRLQSRVDQALAALGDGPLQEPTSPTAPSAAAAAASGVSSDGVADLDAVRRRRAASGPDDRATRWPGWGAAAAVAAVLAAIVGVGVVVGGLPGGGDLDLLAGDDAAETAEDAPAGPEAFSDGTDDSAPQDDALTEESAADADITAGQTLRSGPARRAGVDVAQGDLLTLVELAQAAAADEQAQASTSESDADTGDDAADEDTDAAESGQECVEEALRRDTTEVDGRQVWLLAQGTYAGADAVFVVVRFTHDDAEDGYEVLAYDPVDCSLLARDATAG